MLWIGGVGVATALAERPMVAEEIVVHPPLPAVYALSDGTPVWFVARDAVPLVRIEVVLKRGFLSLPVPEAGMMAGALLQNADPAQLDPIGGEMILGVGAQRVWADVEVLSGFEAEAIALLAQALQAPDGSRRALRRQRKRWVTARRSAWRSIGRVHNLALSEALYPPGHPLAFHPTARDWRQVRRRDVAEAWQLLRSSGAAGILVAGDTSAQTVLPLLEQHLVGLGGDQAPLSIPIPRWPVVDEGDPWVVLVDHPGAERAWITHTRPAPGADDAQEAAFAVVNRVLGGDFTSRLVQRLREEDGLVYDISSDLLSWPGMGRVEITCSVLAGAVPEALTAIREEVRGMHQRPPTLEELQAAQRALALEAGRAQQRLSSLSVPLSLALTSGQPPEHSARRLDTQQALTRPQAERLAADVFGHNAGVWLITGDRSVIEPLLDAQGWTPDEIRAGWTVTNGQQ